MDCSPPGSAVHGILQARIRVGCHFLLQGIFPTQGSNPGLLHRRQILYHLSHQGSTWTSYTHWQAFSKASRHRPCHPVGKDERHRHRNNFCGHVEKYLNYSFPQKNPWTFLNHMKFQLKISFFPLKQISLIICNTFSHVAASNPINCILSASGAPSSLASWI